MLFKLAVLNVRYFICFLAYPHLIGTWEKTSLRERKRGQGGRIEEEEENKRRGRDMLPRILTNI